LIWEWAKRNPFKRLTGAHVLSLEIVAMHYDFEAPLRAGFVRRRLAYEGMGTHRRARAQVAKRYDSEALAADALQRHAEPKGRCGCADAAAIQARPSRLLDTIRKIGRLAS
jgi:hypothetical protein